MFFLNLFSSKQQDTLLLVFHSVLFKFPNIRLFGSQCWQNHLLFCMGGLVFSKPLSMLSQRRLPSQPKCLWDLPFSLCPLSQASWPLACPFLATKRKVPHCLWKGGLASAPASVCRMAAAPPFALPFPWPLPCFDLQSEVPPCSSCFFPLVSQVPTGTWEVSCAQRLKRKLQQDNSGGDNTQLTSFQLSLGQRWCLGWVFCSFSFLVFFLRFSSGYSSTPPSVQYLSASP